MDPASPAGVCTVPTRGRLSEVRVVPGGLHVQGWTVPLAGGTVDEFTALCGERRIEAVRIPVAGRDAAAQEGAFALLIPLDASEIARAQDQLLSIVPLVDGCEGYRLTTVPRPTIPLPEMDDLSQIFGTVATERTRAAVHAAWPVGFEYLGYFIDLANLHPDERVLEVGCGPGRMAYALSYYLGASGRYAGFDPMAGPVRWARESIGARAPNFTFRHVDVLNPAYSPAGHADASSFRFPEEDGACDFVFLVSVFTHLLAPTVRRYLSEIRRVLRPGGRCLSSWYLLNAESESSLEAGTSKETFSYPIESGLAQDRVVPETLVAFRENEVRKWLETSGLTFDRVMPGRWCGRQTHLSYQDIILATV